VDGNHPLRGKILQLAGRQLGHVTRAQLLALGCSSRWIDSQIRQGLLIPVHAGVYAVGHVPRHAHCRTMAAVLACGAGAAASHWSGAALWEVAGWPALCEVSAPGNRRRPGVVTHRSRTLSPGEVRRRHGVPVTSPVRTVLDLQSQLSDARLTRLVNDLRTAGHLRATAFGELCARSARVERLLGDGALTRSALEDLFRAFVARHGLPMPELNARVLIGSRMREVDALYRQARLIIELDSWTHHSDRASFESDRAKDAAALAAGYRTLRSTHRRLSQGGAQEAATIREILETRSG
jgi:very-short-patch-repair endonuclease